VARSNAEEKEKENCPENLVKKIDSEMPEPYQEILVTIKGKNGKSWVEHDICMCDEDGYYLDSGNDWINKVAAWMPLPPRSVSNEDIATAEMMAIWYGDDAYWDGVDTVSGIIDKHLAEVEHGSHSMQM